MKPLYYEDYKGMKTTELAEFVQNKIQNKIDETLCQISEK